MKPHIKKVMSDGAAISNKKTSNTCQNFIKMFDGFWTFSCKKSVEPTNNHAEQQIRSFVIYRKLSFGTKSEKGSLFLQRAFTIAATCKKQAKGFVEYLAKNIKAFNANRDPPLLC